MSQVPMQFSRLVIFLFVVLFQPTVQIPQIFNSQQPEKREKSTSYNSLFAVDLFLIWL